MPAKIKERTIERPGAFSASYPPLGGKPNSSSPSAACVLTLLKIIQAAVIGSEAAAEVRTGHGGVTGCRRPRLTWDAWETLKHPKMTNLGHHVHDGLRATTSIIGKPAG